MPKAVDIVEAKAITATYPLPDGDMTVDLTQLRQITVGDLRSKGQVMYSAQLALVVTAAPEAWGDPTDAETWRNMPLKKLGMVRAALDDAASVASDLKGWAYDIADEITEAELEAFTKAIAANDIPALVVVATKFVSSSPAGVDHTQAAAYDTLSYYGTFLPLIKGMAQVAMQAANSFRAARLPASSKRIFTYG